SINKTRGIDIPERTFSRYAGPDRNQGFFNSLRVESFPVEERQSSGFRYALPALTSADKANTGEKGNNQGPTVYRAHQNSLTGRGWKVYGFLIEAITTVLFKAGMQDSGQGSQLQAYRIVGINSE
ncbi:MAG: hypothetical protein U9P14_02605, partial [Gemmatimonadota bacterium]|nr:hypothetical protein [Gemmatimonadota bacterium]